MTTFAAALAQRESRVVRHVRRAVIVVACIYIALFWWSIYRRIWQVLRLETRISSPVLSPGSTLGFDVVASGEVPNRFVLEIVQGARRQIILEQRAGFNRIRTIDPRVFRYTPSVSLTTTMLSQFQAGPATLRLTGFGEQKLLRTPAPRVREVAVQLRP